MLALALSLAFALDSDPEFNKGIQLYRELEYEQAILRFQASSVAPDHTPPEQATVLVWLALSYRGVGDEKTAATMFDDALKRDPDVALPPETPPKLAVDFEARRALAAAPTLAPPGPPSSTAQLPAAQKAPVAPADEPPWLLIGGGSAAAGVGALVGGGVLTALAFGSASRADDPRVFVSDANDLVATANAELATAVVLAVGGVALVATGGILVAGAL